MRQNLAEEREIHRENLVSLIAPHLLQATSATDVSAIESPLHRHETKLMLFVLQVLVQIQMASTHNSAVKGRTCIRRKNKENLLMYVAKGLQSTASSYLWYQIQTLCSVCNQASKKANKSLLLCT
jgi:hypothetical protein